MKYIRVTMPDGSQWDVPAKVIAHHRAEYYKDGYTGAYSEWFEGTLKNNTILIKWATNRMSWGLVEHHAKLVSESNTDFDKGWFTGEKTIVEKP